MFDMGGENIEGSHIEECKREGIEIQGAAPRAPQQIGKVERLNKTIDELTLACMHHANAPASFWQWCMTNVVFVHNNKAYKEKEVDGKKFWVSRRDVLENTQRMFDPKHFRPFGCAAWGYLPKGIRK